MGVITPQCREAGLRKLRSGILENHPRYKDFRLLGYRGKHYRIVRLYGKADQCENIDCSHKTYHRFEWACLDKGDSPERSSWAKLCVYCHRQLDKLGIEPRLQWLK